MREMERHTAKLKSVCEIAHSAGCLLDEYSHGIHLYIKADACELAFESRSSLSEAKRILAFDHVPRSVDRLLYPVVSEPVQDHPI
jgi:hypothetical protein